MENLSERLINKIVYRLIDKELISIEDKEVYQFGIDITLLKTLHIISYIIIAALMDRVFDFVIIFAVFYAIRRNTGGFHAKTRIGCYLFSCAVIFLSLWATRLDIERWVMDFMVVFDLLILLLISPVQNKNRGLEVSEIEYFKHRLKIVFIVYVIVYAVAMALNAQKYITLLVIGLTSATFLTILGKIQSIKKDL